MVANDARLGMESDENELLILFRDGEMRKISRAPKKILARELVKIFSNFATKMFDKKTELITEPT
jgi:phosphopantothenoylcysteine synthetase/decarboxylase